MSEYGFLSIDEVQCALSEGVSPHVVLNVNHETSEVADGAGPVRPGEEPT